MVSLDARANARQVLGDEALAEAGDVPEDWVRFARGRDLFVNGWGPFDVREAYKACRHDGLPSATTLRAVGYALKGFPALGSRYESLLHILTDPYSPLARHVWRFRKFWAKHVTSLELAQHHFHGVAADQLATEVGRHPRQVLQQVWEQRHLERELASLRREAFHWLGQVPDVESGRGVLEVLKTPRRVLEIGLALRNCCSERREATVYIDKIRRGEIALVALLLDGKPKALVELRFQMRVDAGFDAQFRELLHSKELFARLRTNCSPEDWDLLMHDVDRDVIKGVSGYDACVPSRKELRERGNREPRLEFRLMYDRAEPEMRQHLLSAWAVVALRAVQPRFTWWDLGPRVAMGLGSALAENKTARLLDVSGRSVSDAGVCALAEALRHNRTLEALVLAYNDLGDKAAGLLGGVLAVNHGLRKLSLAHNNITQAGAQLLAEGLRRNVSLQLLDLRRNGLPTSVGELDTRIRL